MYQTEHYYDQNRKLSLKFQGLPKLFCKATQSQIPKFTFKYILLELARTLSWCSVRYQEAPGQVATHKTSYSFPYEPEGVSASLGSTLHRSLKALTCFKVSPI